MKKTAHLILTLIIIATSSLTTIAQGNSEQRTKWMKEVRNYKYEFFTKELELTKEQQSAFFPLYEEMEKELFNANKEAKDIEKKIAGDTSANDTEYEAAALAITKVSQKEGEIEMKYFEKFEKILNKKQLFLLKRAESKFTQQMLNHHRKAGRQ